MTRALRPVAAFALVALLSAGCSRAAAETATTSNSGANNSATAQTDSSAGNNTASTRQQAAKFAECMRANGVKNFPDPDASGTYTIDGIANGSSIDTSSAAFKQAMTACKDLQPAGFVGHKRTAQEQENAVKFAQCIRDNGVKDFPDPGPDDPLVDTDRVPSATGNGLAALNAAMQKCRDFAANAGVVAAR
ncbi:MAG: hypothetical protein JO020_18350 [Chloroflexi bacterium]|nr:hypothetical protein [Chloroflexota bacterium]